MAIIAGAIPWKAILKALPVVVLTAREMWTQWSSRPKKALVDPNADVRTQLASVAERLTALENAETDQARLVSLMAEQLQGIARRTAVAYWLGLGGLLLACVALLLAVFR
jgi:hypothetical protein